MPKGAQIQALGIVPTWTLGEVHAVAACRASVGLLHPLGYCCLGDVMAGRLLEGGGADIQDAIESSQGGSRSGRVRTESSFKSLKIPPS
jgi:hypothetical protein